ncbi:MAG: hypothetical protein KAJ19_11205 [Gammaproteobacteria bacterium]|nr:hypothetical protein [Gammaproteobacteria bacterium]
MGSGSRRLIRGQAISAINSIINALPAGTNELGKTSQNFGGSEYSKEVTLSADAAVQFDVTVNKLIDCMITVFDNDVYVGNAAGQHTILPVGRHGRQYLDASQFYFKNKTAGQNGRVAVWGRAV